MGGTLIVAEKLIFIEKPAIHQLLRFPTIYKDPGTSLMTADKRKYTEILDTRSVNSKTPHDNQITKRIVVPSSQLHTLS